MDFMQEYEKWLHSPALSPEEHAELESIKDDPKEIESRFFGPLEFGTAGLRGTMYTGLHNMNIHVIRWATQGFADVIAAEGKEGKRRGVAICMDCRNHSMEFARAAAEVCAANGIHVRIFESLRPTPELSFAVREYGCQAGINVTASHNPKEYNGYKVYWSDGAQLPPHHADAIAKRLEEIDIFDGVKRMDFDDAVKSGLIETMGDETDRKFMANVTAMINDRETVAKVADTFKLVYTPFHGCGYKLVPEALTALGIKHLIPVPEQMVIDGNFPTVVSPNPENPEGFYLAIDLAKKNDVDFILGTDPDSDRVGIMVRGVRKKRSHSQALASEPRRVPMPSMFSTLPVVTVSRWWMARRYWPPHSPPKALCRLNWQQNQPAMNRNCRLRSMCPSRARGAAPALPAGVGRLACPGVSRTIQASARAKQKVMSATIRWLVRQPRPSHR